MDATVPKISSSHRAPILEHGQRSGLLRHIHIPPGLRIPMKIWPDRLQIESHSREPSPAAAEAKPANHAAGSKRHDKQYALERGTGPWACCFEDSLVDGIANKGPGRSKVSSPPLTPNHPPFPRCVRHLSALRSRRNEVGKLEGKRWG